MIVVDKNNLIHGNTVLQPNDNPVRRKERQNDEKYDKLNKSKKEALRKAKEKESIQKIKVLRDIACFFVVGMMIVGRYSIIYSKQNEIRSIKKDIKTLNKSNDDLRIQLVKYNNISSVDKVAREKLNMIDPTRDLIESCDLTKNNFMMKSKSTPKEEDFFTKIKNMLF